jgi:anti-sigma factor ChrR (cupin superfamily)
VGQKHTSWDEAGWRDSDYGEDGVRLSRIHWFDDADSPYMSMVHFEPGHTAEVHSHMSDYCEIILEGTEQVSRTWYGPGSVRIARGGTFYGPLVAGPEGCTKLVIMRDGSQAKKVFPPRRAAEG